MIDSDALARENFKAKLRAEWTLGTDWAEIAMRHVEAAVAEERERCAALCDEMTSLDHHTRDTRLTAKALAAAIRAGSPAPTAPVVWTDEQVDQALYAYQTTGGTAEEAMRAALEAASREGK